MLKTEHLTGNVRLVPLDRLPLVIAAIRLLELNEWPPPSPPLSRLPEPHNAE
jgi:hypothetical protein